MKILGWILASPFILCYYIGKLIMEGTITSDTKTKEIEKIEENPTTTPTQLLNNEYISYECTKKYNFSRIITCLKVIETSVRIDTSHTYILEYIELMTKALALYEANPIEYRQVLFQDIESSISGLSNDLLLSELRPMLAIEEFKDINTNKFYQEHLLEAIQREVEQRTQTIENTYKRPGTKLKHYTELLKKIESYEDHISLPHVAIQFTTIHNQLTTTTANLRSTISTRQKTTETTTDPTKTHLTPPKPSG